MRFLVIGLGSMGKRRIRCLKALGHQDITGFDTNEARRREAAQLYQVNTVAALDRSSIAGYDALVLSVPPDIHVQYMKQAVELGKPAFIEASVVRDGLRELESLATRKGTLLAPSCTLRFHPAIKDIRSLVKSGTYGAFTNFSYHSGQYLPDWHPWEKVTDYYVSNRDTGGGREIVPFELTWIIDVLGFPQSVTGYHGGTMDVGAAIDDTYVLALRFSRGYGTLLVDVVSRYAVRSLVLNMERGQIVWRWDEPGVRLYESEKQRWITFGQKEASAHAGYNKNIIEDMYIEELAAFINASQGRGTYPHSLADDIRVLDILYVAEGR